MAGVKNSFKTNTFACFKKSPQTESCTDSGAENEGSCHSDQMSNEFCSDDGIDEGICLESNSTAERISKAAGEKVLLFHVCLRGSVLAV